MRAPNVNPWVVAFVVVVSVVMIALAYIWAGIFNNDADAASNDCPSGYACSYSGKFFNGQRVAHPASLASAGRIRVGERLSAKNRFGDRAVHLYALPSPSPACLRAGANNDSIYFNAIDIRPRGSGC